HIHRLGGHVHLIHAFPWPFEIRSAGWDHAHLRKRIALLLLCGQGLANGIRSDGGVSDAFGPAETGFDRAFVLVDGINTGYQIPAQEPNHEAYYDSKYNIHMLVSCPILRGHIMEANYKTVASLESVIHIYPFRPFAGWQFAWHSRASE